MYVEYFPFHVFPGFYLLGGRGGGGGGAQQEQGGSFQLPASHGHLPPPPPPPKKKGYRKFINNYSRYPIGISTEFCFRWQKKLFKVGRGRGYGGKGEKKLGEKTEGRYGKEKKKRENHGERVNRTTVTRIDLAQESNALKLQCEQFWTFIVIVTFDLLRTLLRMRVYEQTNKDNYI